MGGQRLDVPVCVECGHKHPEDHPHADHQWRDSCPYVGTYCDKKGPALMAQLPSGDYLIQQVDDTVILFERHTEREIVRFDPADSNASARAQASIYESDLSAEDKCFAHFWSGYFYAHAQLKAGLL